MRTTRSVVSCAVLLLAGTVASAEKLKGFIVEASPSLINVDGQKVALTADTKVERPNQKDMTIKDLHVGWEVEVETREAEGGWIARQVKVKDARFQEEDIEGIIDGVYPKLFLVDGDELRMPKGAPPPAGLKEGMRFKGKGIRMDDRSLEVKSGQVLPQELGGEEAQYMAEVKQEIGQVKGQIKKINDPELQAYVEKVGRSLVPKWVDPQQLNFTFTLIDDPSLNAFALPDGTVVVHSGLIAALDNEAQLATVLGHEIAHATHRHGYKGYKAQQSKSKWFGLGGMIAGAVVGTQSATAASLISGAGSQVALQAAVNGHGRKLEDEADAVGLYYMVKAGYDYMEAPEVWRVFGKYTKDQDKVSNRFFSDHSTHQARINNLTKAINLDYRNFIPRDKLRTGEAEHMAAVEHLKQATAMANYEGKQYAQAARSLQASLDRNPSDAQAHYNLGRVLWAQGNEQNAQRAMDEFATAVQLDPKMAAPWRDAGVILYEMRDVNRAAQAFEKYLQLAPDAPEAPQIKAFLNMVKNQ